MEELKPCHLLYISRSERENLPAIFSRLEHSNVLTVGDAEEFTNRGGAVRFFIDKDRLRFEINQAAIRKAGLVVSSQLLKLAKIAGPEGKE